MMAAMYPSANHAGSLMPPNSNAFGGPQSETIYGTFSSLKVSDVISGSSDDVVVVFATREELRGGGGDNKQSVVKLCRRLFP